MFYVYAQLGKFVGESERFIPKIWLWFKFQDLFVTSDEESIDL